MPNRILRDWTDSEPVNGLSAQAERFFVRLIMKVDDYGRQTANAKLLRAMLFPLTLDQVRETDLQRWIAECERAGLVRLYGSAEKPVLEIQRFNQRVRAESSKFPSPGDDGPMTVNRPQGADRPPLYAETESETKAHPPAPHGGGMGARWKTFWDEYPKKSKRDEAWAAFKALAPDDALLAVMLAALARKVKSAEWQREEGRYVPRAVDWLTDRRWEEFAARRGKTRPAADPELTDAERAAAREAAKEAAELARRTAVA